MYSFIATGPTASFPFTSISNCVTGLGIQARVYDVTTSANGCCTSFQNVSNCYSPGSLSLGTVTANGLITGQTYLLMIDGYKGDACNFTISNWTATGILPINLLTFVGKNEGSKNLIQWVTAPEKNTQVFELEKSKSGIYFEKVSDVNAHYSSQSTKYYSAWDIQPYEEITDYRLKLIYFGGTSEYSNIISVNNSNLTDYISDVRPNPIQNLMEFDVNAKSTGRIHLQIYDSKGNIIQSEQQFVEEGYQSLKLDLSTYDSGIYLLKVIFENSGKTVVQSILKN